MGAENMQADMARSLARTAHRGQVDKLGDPYIGHVSRVANTVLFLVSGTKHERRADDFVTVAWLHDVVEDTDLGLDDLRREFSDEVVLAVDLLTHRPHQPNVDYLHRVNESVLSRWVKMADNLDNSDPARHILIDDQKTRDRLRKKYQSARTALQENDALLASRVNDWLRGPVGHEVV